LKSGKFLSFVVVFFLFESLTFATDFFDIQQSKDTLSLVEGSENSLRYKEYDKNMRIIKETVWKNDFSAIEKIIIWSYSENSPYPEKITTTYLEDGHTEETEYLYDKNNKQKSKTVTIKQKDFVVVTKEDYLYHIEKNKKGESVEMIDTTTYIDGILSQKIRWLTTTKKEVTKFFTDGITVWTLYENGVKKSERFTQNGIQIRDFVWD